MSSKDGLFKRGNIWWTRIGGERVSTKCRDRQAARLQRAELERRHADPAYRAAHETTLARALRDMIDALDLRQAPAATKRYRTHKAAHLTRVLGANTRLAALTRDTIKAYVKTREGEGAHRHTVHKELATLRVTLRGAAREGRFTGDIATLTLSREYASGYEPRKRYLSHDEIPKLLDALKDHPDRQAFVAFVIATGARLSEAMRARPEDVTREPILSVRIRGTKTEAAARTVPIARMFRPLVAYFDGRLPLRSWSNLSRDLVAACERAGIERVSPNDLRRTTASLLHQSGVSLDVLRHVMGHTTTEMLERVYGRTEVSVLAAALDVGVERSAEHVGTENAQDVREPAQNPDDSHDLHGLSSHTSSPNRTPDEHSNSAATERNDNENAASPVQSDRSPRCNDLQGLAHRNDTADPEPEDGCYLARSAALTDRADPGLLGYAASRALGYRGES